MTDQHPIGFDVECATTFDRGHVLLRVALLVVIGWVAHPIGLLWVGLPVVAAIFVSQHGGQRYLDENGPGVTTALKWILGLTAYVALLTDRLPRPGWHAVRFEVKRSGSPTVSSALLRIVYAIPSLVVLAIVTFVASLVWVVAMLLVLADGRYPAGMWRFLFGVVQWEARLLAYLASLVDDYPPFSLAPKPVSAVQ